MTVTNSTLSVGPVGIPASGRVVALVIGVETYQSRGALSVPPVDYARNDATEFAKALREIYPEGSVEVTVLVDNEATFGNVGFELKQLIHGLSCDDLFIVYYAGHGFHGAGGNRITVWDTHPHNIEGTTVLLRDVLFDPLAESDCTRSLVFIDACATRFKSVGRDVVSKLAIDELRQFLDVSVYSGIFLSCEPGQKSYPANKHKHGAWTYFLLRALRGGAEEALDRDRYLTDASLRDYLRMEVPRFITRETTFKGVQKPQAIITASNTFAIRQIPQQHVPASPEGDFSAIALTPRKEFFEFVDSKPFKTLPGFARTKGHFVPDRVSDQATAFVRSLVSEQIDEEVQELYNQTKGVFGLKRRDVQQASEGGQGSLDTPYFRFSIDARQNRTRADEWVVLRRLELREGGLERLNDIDATFGGAFDRIVVQTAGDLLEFDDLVDFLEGVVDAHGGDLIEQQNQSRVIYTAPDRTRITFDTRRQRVTLSTGARRRCSELIAKAHAYRFSLTAPSRLLLS